VNEKGVSIVFVSQTNALVKGMFFVYHISIIEIEKRRKMGRKSEKKGEWT